MIRRSVIRRSVIRRSVMRRTVAANAEYGVHRRCEREI